MEKQQGRLITVRVSRSLDKRLRLRAAQLETSRSAVIRQILERALATKQKRKPSQ